MRTSVTLRTAAVVLSLLGAPEAFGQPASPVSIPWNRFYDYPEVTEILDRLVAAWPQYLTKTSLGKSVEGRDMWLVTVCNPATGPEAGKPAMWIDANVHGNEVQGTEVCLYTIWFLMVNRERLPKVKDLVDRRVFYVLPMVNPDGRAHWFNAPNTASSSRSGLKPVDNDHDGLFDEDGPDDIDGDGEILLMRRRVEVDGTHRVSGRDPRILERVRPGEKGDFIVLGLEGSDEDGDGRIDEDGPGGYDMNRNWPADWQPEHVQYGAGDYPLSLPETRCIAEFILAHPNIAAIQSYHNNGGMILRGPGAKDVPEYPAADLAVYDQLGREGEEILPFYRYMIVWKDLYSVHGGFVNFGFETLGVFSFTNELWSGDQYFGRAREGEDYEKARERQLRFDDLVLVGETFVDWKPAKHPTYGDVELGGFRRATSRVPPPFMIEEMCHRNMAFTLRHADMMPDLALRRPEVGEVRPGAWRVRATVENRRLIPTIAAHAAKHGIGAPDIFSIGGAGATVVAGGFVRGPRGLETVDGERWRPGRLAVPAGVPGYGTVTVEWIVTGRPPFEVRYASSRGGEVRIAATVD